MDATGALSFGVTGGTRVCAVGPVLLKGEEVNSTVLNTSVDRAKEGPVEELMRFATAGLGATRGAPLLVDGTSGDAGDAGGN